MPEKGLEGTAGLRYNSGSDEKLASAGATVALGSQFALRVEGSKREANDYIAPNYFHEHEGELEKERRVGNTFAKGETVSVGGSWIGERGFAGIAYTNRQDQYGLPGHSHEYESCHPMRHLHCNGVIYHGHTDDMITQDTTMRMTNMRQGLGLILKSERYDFRTEILNPLAGFRSYVAHASYTDYQHDEIEGDSVATTFKSKGYDARLEMVHQPIADWEGVVGVQYNQQKLDITGEESILEPTKTQKWSVFGLEHKQWNDFHFELGARVDQQTD